MISRGLRPCLVGGSFALCGNHPPPHCSTRSQVGTCSRALGFEQSVSQRGEEDLYICGGNLASKVTSAGFLDLVVTACHLGVDEEATSSGVGCLKVSATTCLVEWAAGRRKASAEIWVTDAAGAVTHPSSSQSLPRLDPLSPNVIVSTSSSSSSSELDLDQLGKSDLRQCPCCHLV